jgi:RND family efflux transporter MFP subunit
MFYLAKPGVRVRMWGIAIAALLISTAFRIATPPVSAHEGHDHAPPAASLPTTTLPRAVAAGDAFEAVAVLLGDGLRLTIDRYADNAPVAAAVVTVTLGNRDIKAVPNSDGTYRLAAPELMVAGRHDIVIGIQDGATSDLLITTLETPLTGSLTAASGSVGVTPTILSTLRQSVTGLLVPVLGAFVVMGIAAGFLLRRKVAVLPNATKTSVVDKRTQSVAVVLGLLVGLADSPSPARAYGDEDHGAAKVPAVAAQVVSAPTAFATDSPRRLADGSVFLTKTSQRLLDVRTLLAKEAPQTPRQSFVGRIIANPNRSGLVQSSTGGRISPPAAGFPKLGQSVKAGDVLATVTPALLAIDASQIGQTAGDLDQQIALAKTKLDRARKLLETNAGTRVQVEETELTLKGLERRRVMLANSEVKAEAMVAPVDGVISSIRAVPGQVVAPQDVLFEIVDPGSRWVEAFVFDATGSLAFKQPVASSADGRTFPLTFLGRSQSLRQQSAILQFEITDRVTGLDVGSPVTVHALSGDPVRGVVLPRAAVVRAANGEDIVWRHTEPERFVAQPVRVSPFDGAQVLVQAGLKSGERIVVQGAELINQVR